MTSAISTVIDKDGIAVLTWNTPDSAVNLLTDKSLSDLDAAVKSAVENDQVKGIVLTSAKSDWVAGADLAMLEVLASLTPEEVYQRMMKVHASLRFMETCKLPVVAAINGTALGGGLEVALACHYRVAANNPKLKLGFPEVTFGLFPGAGGTQRLPRLVKLQDALRLLTEGKQVGPEEAQKLNIVHKVVAPDQLLEEAKAYIRNGGSAEQPWDVKGFRLPSDDIHSARGFETFVGANGLISKMTNCNYPAPIAILECVYHGLQLTIDEGSQLEARKFTKVIRSSVAKNMIRTMFFSMNNAAKLKDRPKHVPQQKVTKLGMVGAGLMGAGITYVSALSEIEVVLIDSTLELAEKGKAACAKLIEKRVARGKTTKEKSEALLNRITVTTDYAMLSDCSLIIEAVYEDPKVKEEVLKKIDAAANQDAVIASNTSSLPISSLAQNVSNQKNFIGIHFFSPVDKMQLVEVIRGKKTSDEAVATALDFIQQIRKTPIVVNDSHGFYTTRVFSTYTNEGVHLLSEGVAPALIENAGRIAGMPMGPLEVADMVGLDTVQRILAAAKTLLGDKFQDQVTLDIITRIVQNEQRLGQKNGKGFYDYNGKEKRLWKGISTLIGKESVKPELESVQKRLLVIQAIEAIRCLEEGVVLEPADADVGSILGWGFCPFHGGIASYVDTVGTKWLLEEATRLEQTAGPRFAPPELLKQLGKENKRLFDCEREAKELAGVK